MTENNNSFISKIRSKLPNLKDPRIRLKFILTASAFGLIVLFVSVLFVPFSSNPHTCAVACHSMNREYETWKRSSHSNVPCVGCHAKPGLSGLAHEKIVEATLAIKGEILGHEAPINISGHLGEEGIPRESCERCHNLVTRNVTPSRIFSARMYGTGNNKYHNKHLKKGIPCTLCHNRVAHKDVNEPEILKAAGYSKENSKYDEEVIGKEYEDGLSMTEGCFRCHAPAAEKRDHELIKKYRAEKAPKECVTCHIAKLLPIGHRNNDWRSEHPIYAKKNTKYCFECHGKKGRFNFEDKVYCTRCHSQNLVNSWAQ